MKKHRLCKATTVVNHQLLRCQELAGHQCAHYCDHFWWDNKRGLPMDQHRSRMKQFVISSVLFVLFWILVAVIAHWL